MQSILRRRAAMLLLASALAACGGGGGDSGSTAVSEPPVGPPTTAASMGTTATDATEAVKSALAGASGIIDRHTSLTSFTALMGVPIAQGQAVPTAIWNRALAAAAHPDRIKAMAVRTVTCVDVVDPPCSGSATLDTNIPDTATSVSAGQYVEVGFSNISGYALGTPVTLNGALRIEFLSSVNFNAAQLTSVSLRLKFTALSGTASGAVFGPVTEVLDLGIDNLGNTTLTSSGARYTNLSAVTVSGTGTYGIGGGTVRAAYGSSGGYADLTLSNWRSSANRPVVGSQGTLTVGSGRATVRVTSSSTTTVVYAVTLTLGSTTVNYQVTATYTGGVPSYSALQTA